MQAFIFAFLQENKKQAAQNVQPALTQNGQHGAAQINHIVRLPYNSFESLCTALDEIHTLGKLNIVQTAVIELYTTQSIYLNKVCIGNRILY